MAYKSTKRGKPVGNYPTKAYGFRWFGKDDRGVSVWQGQWNALTWGVRILGGIGIGLLFLALILLVVLPGPPIGPAICAGLGLLEWGLARWMDGLRRRFVRLKTAEQVASEQGLTQDELDSELEERGVLPRAVINGEAHYDPADFDDAMILLRPAHPAEEEELLRPAASSAQGHETLLQPVDAAELRTQSEVRDPEEVEPRQHLRTHE